MEGSGLDAWIPSWAQAAIAVGGVIAGMAGWMYRNLKDSPHGASPEILATRNDFIEIFKAETRANHDILASNASTLRGIMDATIATRDAVLRLIAVNEMIARRSESEANDARVVEIAERVARHSREDRARNERNMNRDE